MYVFVCAVSTLPQVCRVFKTLQSVCMHINALYFVNLIIQHCVPVVSVAQSLSDFCNLCNLSVLKHCCLQVLRSIVTAMQYSISVHIYIYTQYTANSSRLQCMCSDMQYICHGLRKNNYTRNWNFTRNIFWDRYS